MATTRLFAPTRTPTTRIALRVVIALLVLALIIFLAFDVWFYRAVRAALGKRKRRFPLGRPPAELRRWFLWTHIRGPAP